MGFMMRLNGVSHSLVADRKRVFFFLWIRFLSFSLNTPSDVFPLLICLWILKLNWGFSIFVCYGCWRAVNAIH